MTPISKVSSPLDSTTKFQMKQTGLGSLEILSAELIDMVVVRLAQEAPNSIIPFASCSQLALKHANTGLKSLLLHDTTSANVLGVWVGQEREAQLKPLDVLTRQLIENTRGHLEPPLSPIDTHTAEAYTWTGILVGNSRSGAILIPDFQRYRDQAHRWVAASGWLRIRDIETVDLNFYRNRFKFCIVSARRFAAVPNAKKYAEKWLSQASVAVAKLPDTDKPEADQQIAQIQQLLK